MTRNDLYTLAFRYKKTALWKKLWDTEILAIKLSNGETGFVSIMGRLGEYCAIGLYIGDEGFESFRLISNAERIAESEMEYHEMMLQQNSLQLAFDAKDELMPEEVDEVRAYAKANGIRLSGKNAYPQFIKCEPNHMPWKIKKETDLQLLSEAVEAAELFAKLLDKRNPASLGIVDIRYNTKEVPLFEVKDHTIQQVGYAPVPKEKKREFKPLILKNDILAASMKRLPKKGIWEAEFIRMMDPIQNDPEEAPYYPSVFLMAEKESHFVVPVLLDLGDEEDPQTFFQHFSDMWKAQKMYAKEIRCRNERTFAMVEDFCKKTGVKVRIWDDEMEALDEAIFSMFEGLDDEEAELADQMAEVVTAILEMSPAEIREIPKPMIYQLKEMLDTGIFPPEITAEMKRKLKNI